MQRRQFIWGASLIGALTATSAGAFEIFGSNEKAFPFTLTDEQWKAKLTQDQYRILRQSKTESSKSSALNDEKREGVYHCAGCDHPLYASEHKYESGTGWPSFFQPFNDKSVGIATDYKLIYPRSEVHCANCGGHLGHVFDDGPQPTGKRYCMNGDAMTFAVSVD